jgi:predicted dinucleotide-binding enzyme
MQIGAIGAGDFAQAFAKRALKAGNKVKLSNNRGPESLREIVNRLGPGAMAATKEEAAACDRVICHHVMVCGCVGADHSAL